MRVAQRSTCKCVQQMRTYSSSTVTLAMNKTTLSASASALFPMRRQQTRPLHRWHRKDCATAQGQARQSGLKACNSNANVQRSSFANLFSSEHFRPVWTFQIERQPIQIEVDHGCRKQGKRLRQQKSANQSHTHWCPKLGAGARAQSQWHGAKNCSAGGHHDRSKAQFAGVVHGIA